MRTIYCHAWSQSYNFFVENVNNFGTEALSSQTQYVDILNGREINDITATVIAWKPAIYYKSQDAIGERACDNILGFRLLWNKKIKTGGEDVLLNEYLQGSHPPGSEP